MNAMRKFTWNLRKKSKTWKPSLTSNKCSAMKTFMSSIGPIGLLISDTDTGGGAGQFVVVPCLLHVSARV